MPMEIVVGLPWRLLNNELTRVGRVLQHPDRRETTPPLDNQLPTEKELSVASLGERIMKEMHTNGLVKWKGLAPLLISMIITFYGSLYAFTKDSIGKDEFLQFEKKEDAILETVKTDVIEIKSEVRELRKGQGELKEDMARILAKMD